MRLPSRLEGSRKTWQSRDVPRRRSGVIPRRVIGDQNGGRPGARAAPETPLARRETSDAYLSGASPADFISSAMSAFEMAKGAGSTGAASGGSISRRMSQARSSRRSSRNAARTNPSANRWRWRSLSRATPASCARTTDQCAASRDLSKREFASEPQKSKIAKYADR